MPTIQKIIPCLWFDRQAEEAAKFYVSVVPSQLPELIGDLYPAKAGRVMKGMLKMKKLDIAALRRAHAG